MSEIHKFSDMGEYHDDEIRLEAYGEIADQNLVETVVDKIQYEVGQQIMHNPKMSVAEIKLAAMHRFIDLINRDLLSVDEADKCYKRFSRQVDHYYGAS